MSGPSLQTVSSIWSSGTAAHARVTSGESVVQLLEHSRPWPLLCDQAIYRCPRPGIVRRHWRDDDGDVVAQCTLPQHSTLTYLCHGSDRLPFQGRNRKPCEASCKATWTSMSVLISSRAAPKSSMTTSNRAAHSPMAAA